MRFPKRQERVSSYVSIFPSMTLEITPVCKSSWKPSKKGRKRRKKACAYCQGKTGVSTPCDWPLTPNFLYTWRYIFLTRWKANRTKFWKLTAEFLIPPFFLFFSSRLNESIYIYRLRDRQTDVTSKSDKSSDSIRMTSKVWICVIVAGSVDALWNNSGLWNSLKKFILQTIARPLLLWFFR